MKIKVCGMKDPGNLKELLSLPIDYAGFIFYEQSPRYIEDACISDVHFPDSVNKVGVFVDETVSQMLFQVSRYSLNIVQLHGKESPGTCRLMKEKGLKVIKSFNISDKEDFCLVKEYTDACDYFLFDTKTSKHGGSGEKFDWNILQYYHENVPFFLSGGIALEDIEKIRSLNHPLLHAVDLNSRFELSPGIKDIRLLKKFTNLIFSHI